MFEFASSEGQLTFSKREILKRKIPKTLNSSIDERVRFDPKVFQRFFVSSRNKINVYEVGGEAYKNGVVPTPLHFLVKVSSSGRSTSYFSALARKYVCVCVPFQAWIFKMALPEDKVSLFPSFCVWKRHVPARNIPRRFTRYRAPRFPLKSYEVWPDRGDGRRGRRRDCPLSPFPPDTLAGRKKNGRKGINLG